MTDAQLSVLLWQIMRQINQEATAIESAALGFGLNRDQADRLTVTLHGVADSLHNSCGDLDKAARATS